MNGPHHPRQRHRREDDEADAARNLAKHRRSHATEHEWKQERQQRGDDDVRHEEGGDDIGHLTAEKPGDDGSRGGGRGDAGEERAERDITAGDQPGDAPSREAHGKIGCEQDGVAAVQGIPGQLRLQEDHKQHAHDEPPDGAGGDMGLRYQPAENEGDQEGGGAKDSGFHR